MSPCSFPTTITITLSVKDTGNISVIDGRMNGAVYQNILEADLMILVKNLELSPD